jgi:uncharacterized small protein (DUF1192 family)
VNITSKTFCNIPAPVHIRPPDQMSYMACCFEQGHDGNCVYGVKSLSVVSIVPNKTNTDELRQEITRLRIEREWKDLELAELKCRIANMTEEIDKYSEELEEGYKYMARLRDAGDALAGAVNAWVPSSIASYSYLRWKEVRRERW